MTVDQIRKLLSDYRAHWNEEPDTIALHPRDLPYEGFAMVDGIKVLVDVNCPRGGYVGGPLKGEEMMKEYLGEELWEWMKSQRESA